MVVKNLVCRYLEMAILKYVNKMYVKFESE